jgi:hypothetical protein
MALIIHQDILGRVEENDVWILDSCYWILSYNADSSLYLSVSRFP